MGRDEEVPAHLGVLHGKNATPHRCIWLLATLSVIIGIVGIAFYLCGPAAVFSPTAPVDGPQKHSIWYLLCNSPIRPWPASSPTAS